MIINFIYLLLFIFVFFWFYINIKKNGLKWIIKGLFQIGILVLFIGGFFKIFFTLPPNLFIKIFFLIIYAWCTVGINVNFMIPLISLIDQKIVKKYRLKYDLILIAKINLLTLSAILKFKRFIFFLLKVFFLYT